MPDPPDGSRRRRRRAGGRLRLHQKAIVSRIALEHVVTAAAVVTRSHQPDQLELESSPKSPLEIGRPVVLSVDFGNLEVDAITVGVGKV
jgi:hypothetical protein